jgi:hypothetical protein
MKKITLKIFTFFCLLFAVSIANAQQLKPLNTSKKISSVQEPNFELTSQTIDCIENTGYARCLTDENEVALQKSNPERLSIEEFESWLKPHIDKIKADREAGRSVAPIYNIPVVIHIIHNGDAVGSGENISDAQALSQIQVMNEDFQRLAGSRGGANTTGEAVDVQINFCMAQQDPTGNPSTGIVRHNIPPYSNTVTNGSGGADWETRADVQTMKTNTQWDPNRYLNMWTIRPGGLSLQNGGLSGLLGYAQFPNNSGLGGINANNGNANTDGVVAAFDAMGTQDLDDGSFTLNATYNLGRTMTHEVGHWVGLRHIWGDNTTCTGGANAGDYCADTPESTTANYSCVTVDNCPADGLGNDQVQNYMDYTNDACMDTFTQNQKDRILAVMTNSPRRGILNNSNTCNAAAPTVNFTTAAPGTVNEGSDCNFTDFTFAFSMSSGGSQNTVASFNVAGSSTQNLDYQLLNNSINFAANATAASGNSTVTLRVFNDGFVEGNETLTLSVNVNTTGNAIATLATYNLTILDDDFTPSSLSTTSIYTEDFEDLTGSSIFDRDGDGVAWARLNGLDGYAGVVGQCGYSATDGTIIGGAVYTPDNYYATDFFTIPANITSASANYLIGSYATNGNAATNYREHYSIYFSNVDPFATYADIEQNTLVDDREIPAAGTENISTDLSAFAGQTGRLVFRHHNTAGNGLLILDNLDISVVSGKEVQTVVNTANPTTSLLKSTGTIYAEDNVTTNLMNDITSNTSFDYDCISVSVSRAGTGAQGLNGSTGADQVTDKTFTITPSNLNTSGNTTIAFYFTEAEIAGWESATGLNRSELGIRKIGNSTDESVIGSLSAFGTNVKITGTFTTGMEGTYYFGRASSLTTEQFSITGLSVYPNPSNGIVNISFDNAGSQISLNLFDVRGRKVISENFKNSNAKFNAKLNLAPLSKGVYLLEINNAGLKTVKKIVLN